MPHPTPPIRRARALTALIERDREVERIAREYLRLDTLQERKSDRLDFSEQSVWGLKAALERAYEAGRDSAREELTALLPGARPSGPRVRR